jgi:FMN phosphatase YigB (HAD superfamily)
MLHVGDSLLGDVGAAKEMGAYAAWARYGTVYDPADWQRPVRITHWSDGDVRSAEAARHHHQGTRPDAVLSGFGDLLFHFAFGRTLPHP